MARLVPAQAAFAAANVLALALFSVVVSFSGSGDGHARAASSVGKGPSDVVGTPVLYVSGRSRDDQLVGRAAAAAVGGQVRVVGGPALNRASRAEILALAPARVVLVGGEEAVSDAVLGELRRLLTRPVSRAAGADRYETAARVALSAFRPPVSHVVVFSGDVPNDVLGGPAATEARGPALFVDSKGVPPQTAEALRELKPDTIVVQGGAADVPDSVVAALDALTDGTIMRSE